MESYGKSRSVSFIRPADTNAYTAGDVLGASTGATAALTFSGVGRPEASGYHVIRGAELRIDATAVPSGMSFFTLHLYSATPPSALADNAAFDLPSGDRSVYLGSVVIGTPVDLGSTLYVRADNLNVDVELTGTALYGYLVSSAAWTPAARTVFTVTLHVMAV